jgi:hypothetical protein
MLPLSTYAMGVPFMDEIFRFMALRPPDTSNLSPTIDISNPKSPFQQILTTERNRAIGQPNRRGDSSPRNLTFRGVPLRALHAVSVAASTAPNPTLPQAATASRTAKAQKAKRRRKPK